MPWLRLRWKFRLIFDFLLLHLTPDGFYWRIKKDFTKCFELIIWKRAKYCQKWLFANYSNTNFWCFSSKACLKANYKSSTELFITILFAVKNMKKSTTWKKFFTNWTWKCGGGNQKAATEKKNFFYFLIIEFFHQMPNFLFARLMFLNEKKSVCRAMLLMCYWLLSRYPHHSSLFRKKNFHTLWRNEVWQIN